MSSTGEVLTSDGKTQRSASAPAVDRGTTRAETDAPAKKKSRRGVLFVVLGVVALGALIYYLHGRHFEDTDDAQVDGNISAIGPRVSGTVTAVDVIENQSVNAGDPLLEIDPTDLQVAVVQAKASVAQAQAQLQAEDPTVSITETSNTAAVAGASSELLSATAGVTGAERDVEQLTARLAEAEGNARLAQIERKRGEDLWKAQAIPRADLDKRVTTAETAQAEADAARQALASAKQRVSAQEAQLGATKSRLNEVRKNAPRQVETRKASVEYRQANLELAQAELKQAELNLSYAKVRTPVAGVVAKKAVNVGDHVSPGQQLVAVAQTGDLWVTANFRETQIERMKPGMSVDLHVDALGANMTGKIESIGGATGSRLSVLPPENASGNYVKVVQRIPVRIRLDPGQSGLDRLRPGMSVEPKVRVSP
ncbi:MAG TPA: HlyD family secretion protein [Polyangia bacterium]|nr:HlyD family secretion protein [Polyangia bacterium]